jgi:hypothetical protein
MDIGLIIHWRETFLILCIDLAMSFRGIYVTTLEYILLRDKQKHFNAFSEYTGHYANAINAILLCINVVVQYSNEC